MPKLKIGGASCQCGGCDKYFKSEAGFNRHRIDDKLAEYGRRCMDTTEMVNRGMSTNEGGFWITAKMPDSVVSSRSKAFPG